MARTVRQCTELAKQLQQSQWKNVTELSLAICDIKRVSILVKYELGLTILLLTFCPHSFNSGNLRLLSATLLQQLPIDFFQVANKIISLLIYLKLVKPTVDPFKQDIFLLYFGLQRLSKNDCFSHAKQISTLFYFLVTSYCCRQTTCWRTTCFGQGEVT